MTVADIPVIVAFVLIFYLGWLLGKFDRQITQFISGWFFDLAVRLKLRTGVLSID